MDVCPTGRQTVDDRQYRRSASVGSERPGHDEPNENPHKADNRDMEFRVSSAAEESVSAVSGAPVPRAAVPDVESLAVPMECHRVKHTVWCHFT